MEDLRPVNRRNAYEELEKKIKMLEEEVVHCKRTEEALRESERKYRLLTEWMMDIVWTLDMSLRTTYVSPSIMKVLGFTPEERLMMEAVDVMTPESYARTLEILALELENEREGNADPERSLAVEIEYYHKDGHTVWTENMLRGIRNPDGNLVGIHGVSRDITNRKKYEEALKISERKYYSIFNHSIDSILLTKSDGSIIDVNPAACEMFGRTIDEIQSIGVRGLVDVKDHRLHDALGELSHTGRTNAEITMIRSNGEKFPVEMSATAFVDTNGHHKNCTIIRDITDRKRAEEALAESENRYRELSIVDDLTQLYNSRHFYNQLRMELNRADRYEQPLTLLLLDLDNFKAFNDSYGHLQGDQVLSRFGGLVKDMLRQADSAYRYGGEEFTILLPMTTSDNGVVAAERIRKKFKKEKFTPMSDKGVHMTVSIGVAQYKPGEGMRAFVDRADRCMYQAKKDGKDRVSSESSPQGPSNG
jgi:diguanylate cyclase (GGDEF)-like protein/PAS domain S-box-containing protein